MISRNKMSEFECVLTKSVFVLPMEGLGVLVMTSWTVCVIASFVMAVLVCDCGWSVVLAVLGTSVTLLLSFVCASSASVIALDVVSVDDEVIVVVAIG